MGNPGFVRRFTTDPTEADLLAIEGVVIIDRDPPAEALGAGTGTVLMVAEFEDGPFVPTQVASGNDLLQTFGGFGFGYAGVAANNPCARSRRSDGALNPEYWNGNGYVACANKTFAGLVVHRVDTSVGSVSFSRLAALSGANDFTFNLTTGQTVIATLDGGSPATATFTGAAATLLSADGVFASTFVGGESITFTIDDTSYTAVFLAADQTHVQIVARLNAAAGYTAFAVSTLKTSITGRLAGTSGNVRITAVSAVLVTTATGFTPAAATAGTGNVGNIRQVTSTEANTIIAAAITGSAVDRDVNGAIRFVNTATPATGAILFGAGTATAFGWTSGTTVTAASGSASVIPAGTQVRTAGGVEWVTMQTIQVTGVAANGAGGAGPYAVKVRPGLDDGTIGAATAGTVTVIPTAFGIDAFSVVNLLPLAVALTEAQLDAQYVATLATSTSPNTVVKIVNVVVSARSSNAVRAALKANALAASANGCYGRSTCVRPPLGTARATARSLTAQPGVGAYRTSRLFYCYPGAQTYIPAIAARGVAGGVGFTASGLIDTGFDTWAAAVISQLPPEENPGQETSSLDGITAIEAGNPDVQAMTLGDYELFRAAGIAALRIDGSTKVIQSGVTSVDPAIYPNLKNIARRRYADFLADSLTPMIGSFIKKLAGDVRRAVVVSVVETFMAGQRSIDNPANQRVDSYKVDGKAGNTPSSLAKGIFRVTLRARTLPSMDVIVLDVAAGETVVITDTAAA